MNLVKNIFEDALPAAGTGSLSDLGEPPVVGVSSTKKKSIHKLVPTRRVTEAADDIDPEDTVATEDELDREGREDNRLDTEDTVETDDTEEEAPPPVYGQEDPEGSLDQEAARSILDDTEEDEGEEEGPEEEDDEAPKVSMARILQYKVFKPMTTRHSDPNGSKDIFSPRLLKDMRLTGKSPVESFTGRLFIEAIGNSGGLQRSKDLSIRTPLVMGEVTSKNGRYIFTAQITTGKENREFVFEGDRTHMEALLTIMKASMKDIPGNAGDIVDEVDTRVSPVEVLVNQNELLTDGVKYVKQIVAQ